MSGAPEGPSQWRRSRDVPASVPSDSGPDGDAPANDLGMITVSASIPGTPAGPVTVPGTAASDRSSGPVPPSPSGEPAAV